MASHTTHGHEDAAHDVTPKSKSSYSAAFWFVLLLIGLFIAALNFIEVMSHGEGEKEGAATEEVSSQKSADSEHPTGTTANDVKQSATADTTHSEAAAH